MPKLTNKQEKELFRKNKYVWLSFDWESTALWDGDGNTPLEYFDWKQSPRGHYIKKALYSLAYVFNSRPVPMTDAEINEGIYASEYVIEQILKVAISMKKEFPDWTIEIDNYYEENGEQRLVVTEDMNAIELINKRRHNSEVGHNFIILEN